MSKTKRFFSLFFEVLFVAAFAGGLVFLGNKLAPKVTAKYIDESNVVTFLNFDNRKLNETVGDHDVEMIRGSSEYEERTAEYGNALILNPKNQAARIDDILLGSGDFTISFDVKLDSVNVTSYSAAYELFSSTMQHNDNVHTDICPETATDGGTYREHDPYHDGSPHTFQISSIRNNSCTSVRVGLGQNDGKPLKFVTDNDAIVFDEWQRYTLVVDRNFDYDESHTTTYNHYYDDNGNFVCSNYRGISATYSTPEKVRVTFYLDSKRMGFVDVWMNKQTVGSGYIYLGGNRATFDSNFSMDNVLIYNKAMTNVEVADIENYVRDKQ